MKPLQAIGMGLVVIALEARFGDWDASADPLGWLLVLLGLRTLRPGSLRTTLWYLGTLATLVSTVVWFPAAASRLDDADPALVWAADLPALGFLAVLCHVLAVAAGEARDRFAAGWLRVAEGVLAFGIVAPVAYFGGGWTSLRGLGDLGLLVQLLLIVLCFVYAGRAWAGGASAPSESTRP